MRLLLGLVVSVSAYAAACLSATPECTEWIGLTQGPERSLVYRTFPLELKNDEIRRALVMVHGAGRDAVNYFRSALAAGFLADALSDTLIIAPRFASNDRGCGDSLAPNEVNWACSGNSWRSGGVSLTTEHLTSYDFMDALLRKLARKDLFPNLKAIVLAGHSAGGQFVTRYEMASPVGDELPIPLTYVVSNPSSYAYPDLNRPAAEGGTTLDNASLCPAYNQWPYGLQNRTGYTANLDETQLKKQLVARPVTYLLGEVDTLPLGGFDSSCAAMAQGATRRARGESFARYVNQKYGAKHKLIVIPLCGHNARCMFTAEPSLPILFLKAEE